MKLTDFLSRNPVEDAKTENIYDEQYAINILTEQAELNLKYGRIVYEPITTNTDNKITRERKSNNQSETNRTFEKKRHVNKRNEQATTSPNDSEIKFKRHTNYQYAIVKIYHYRHPKKWTENIFIGER